jgi:hypothetical protein
MVYTAINIAWSTFVFGPHLERNGGRARPEMRESIHIAAVYVFASMLTVRLILQVFPQ